MMMIRGKKMGPHRHYCNKPVLGERHQCVCAVCGKKLD
jgi:hypothetical protein